MEKLLNLTLVEGRLTKDPEIVRMSNGHELCKFDIAVNSSIKSNGEKKNVVDYFSINVWNKLADACFSYLKKGSKVRIRGKLKQNNWVASDGKRVSKVYIDAAHVEFINTNPGHQMRAREKDAVPF